MVSVYLIKYTPDHLKSVAGGCVRSHAGRCVQSEKGGIDSTCLQFRQVNVPPLIILPDIASPHHHGRGIAVRIKNKHYLRVTDAF